MSAGLLSIFVVLTIVWAVVTFLFWSRRRWLMFYLFGALGFVLLVVYAAAFMGFDDMIEGIEAAQVGALAGFFGITLDVMGTAGLAVRNHVGWAVFDIGIECSAILEIAAVTGLVAFYPAFSLGRKIITIVIGAVATYILNLFRILLIVWIIDVAGTGWVFPAHAVFGRIFFFIGTVAIYWFLVTRPSIGILGDRMRPQHAEVAAVGTAGATATTKLSPSQFLSSDDGSIEVGGSGDADSSGDASPSAGPSSDEQGGDADG